MNDRRDQPVQGAAAGAPLRVNRREALCGGGLLMVALVAPGAPAHAHFGFDGTAMPDINPRLDPSSLDAWLAVTATGRVRVFFGKMDMGQGVDTAIAQFVADELDVAVSRIDVVMGDTALTLNQGGASSATGVETGAIPLRNAAAEARRVLLQMAASRLGTEVRALTVTDGLISDGHSSLSYWELIGDRRFDVQLMTSGQGNRLNAWGEAPVKPPSAYRVVGTSVPRVDMAPKVFGTLQGIDSVRVAGMWHARMLRPPTAGAVPVRVDESSIAHIPEARAIGHRDLLAVAAPDEWDAIRARDALAVEWSAADAPFPEFERLYDHIRRAPVRFHRTVEDLGDVDAALAGAARVIEATYEWPFHSHACMAPACAVADVRDGHARVWTGSQKPHYTREGIAALLEMPAERVRVTWVPGPGSYGRNEADDAAADAAVLSHLLGRPVRVQYMRDEGHGWDPKGPAAVMTVRAGLDADGTVVAWDWHAKGFSAHDVRSNASRPGDLLTGQLLGHGREQADSFGVPMESYGFANRRTGWSTIAPLLERASPLRTAHIRDPQGPQTTFSSECFWDEVAAELREDPVQFRLRYLQAPRDIAALRAVAEAADWQSRPSPNPHARDGDLLHGRGVAYCQRGRQTIVAIVIEVAVDTRSGRIGLRRVVVSHDCGLVVNPEGLRNTIHGAVMQAISRTIREEVRFDRHNVTSLDWNGYPIAEIADAPERFDIVLLDDPEAPPLGAGEPAHKPVAAALANAMYDATGVRFRRLPLTPQRVLDGLAGG